MHEAPLRSLLPYEVGRGVKKKYQPTPFCVPWLKTSSLGLTSLNKRPKRPFRPKRLVRFARVVRPKKNKTYLRQAGKHE